MNVEQPTTGIMVRSVEAVAELRDLCEKYVKAQIDIQAFSGIDETERVTITCHDGIAIEWSEVLDILKQRRQAIVTLLENKGVRVSEPK
jgi:hypothetical protein